MRSVKVLNLNKSALKSFCSFYSSDAATKKATFKFDELQLDLHATKPNLPDDPAKLLFGQKFTDHMFTAEWTKDAGWGKPKVGPFKNLELHPAAKVLHYSIELFEGMKAYYGVDGKVRLFRPDLNALRMFKSANRSGLPSFDQQEFIKCLKKFVTIEKDWIPKSTAASLYLRPTFIGTEGSLGVSTSNRALFYIIASPAGPYFPTGFKPVSLFADPKYVRAFPGGVGAYKVGSNYGPTVYVSMEAQKRGCQQVLWLLGKENLLTEAGTMNMFVVLKHDNNIELVTPPLDGTILEGVTRQSILDLARRDGKLKVSERNITMQETLLALEKNRLLEMFGAGTAAVTCPIERIVFNNKNYPIPTMQNGAPHMNYFLNELNSIYYGKKKHEWGVVCE